MPLNEALAAQPQPLVDPNAVPEAPELAYQQEVEYAQPQYTSEAEFLAQTNNVDVHSAHYQGAVTYDYQQPDNTIFDPTVSAEDIQVAAMYGENGESIANLHESIRRSAEEKEAHKKKAALRDSIISFAIATLVLTLACVGMIFVVSKIPRPKPPQLVASSIAFNEEAAIETQTVKKQQLTQAPAPAVSLDVVAAATSSSFALPSLDIQTSDFGSFATETSFESSLSFGSAESAVSFFGGESSGENFLFVLDASKSMNPEQVKLRDSELQKTLASLRGVKYHVVLFAGGAYFADTGWGNVGNGGKGSNIYYKSPGGKYNFTNGGVVPDTVRAPRWRSAVTSAVRETMSTVKKSELFYGTNWANAIKFGFRMDPAPDVIFFMSDGVGSKVNIDAIEKLAKASQTKINTIAMQTGEGAKDFAAIAKKTKGSYTIVDRNGKALDGFEYLKNPSKFDGRVPPPRKKK